MGDSRNMTAAFVDAVDRLTEHVEWVRAGSHGMNVPFHGDFVGAHQLPSVLIKLQWYARELRGEAAELTALRALRDALPRCTDGADETQCERVALFIRTYPSGSIAYHCPVHATRLDRELPYAAAVRALEQTR